MSRAHIVLGFLQVTLMFLHFAFPPSTTSAPKDEDNQEGTAKLTQTPILRTTSCPPLETKTNSVVVESSEHSQRCVGAGEGKHHTCEGSVVEGGGGTGGAVCLNKRSTLGKAKLHASLSSSSSSSKGGGGTALTVPHALARIDPKTNRISIPKSIKRILVDIGTYLTSPTSMWHGWTEPETFVVGIDANPWTAVIMKYFGTKAFTADAYLYFPDAPKVDGVTPGCDSAMVARCFSHGWYWWKNKTDRQIMIHSAMMDKTKGTQPTGGTFAYFHPGAPNRSDTGSIFEFKSTQLSKMHLKANRLPKPAIAPLLTLAEVLKYLPSPSGLGRPRLPLTVKGGSIVPDRHQMHVNSPAAAAAAAAANSSLALNGRGSGGRADQSFSFYDPAFTSQTPRGVLESSRDLQWDTLKIDAQGADILVLLGGMPEKAKLHSLLERFVCIIGEFDETSYQTSGTDYMAKVKTGKGGKTIGPAAILQRVGFIRLDKMVFVNSRFLHLIYKGPKYYTCEANDVHREHRYFIMKLKKFGYTEKGYNCAMGGGSGTECSTKKLVADGKE